MDFVAAGLLDGLEGEDRDARERLLERLASEGVALEELRAAVAEDRLALLPVERLLGGRYTAAEVGDRTGAPEALMMRIRRLLGLPEAGAEDRVFGDEDVEAARSINLFLEAGFSEAALAEITRVLGEAMGRLAATTTGAFVETFLKPGDSEHDVAQRFAALTEELTPALSPVLISAYKAHLRESVRRGIISRAEREAGQLADAQEVTVCFADLVGFTRLGGELDAHELGSVAGTLAALATEVAKPPVRLVKTIGDAAMFVSPDAGALVDSALSLCEQAEEADLPTVRAGLAYGPVLVRAGDFYGHAVNLASRVTGIARPSSVLCTQAVRDASPEDFQWSFAGRHRLKGIADAVPLYRARRPDKGGDLPAEEHATAPSGTRRARGTTKQKADRPRRRGSR